MSPTIVLALLVAPAPVAAPPPGLLFGFYRMSAFQQRAKDSRCQAGDLDRDLEAIKRQLVARYGKKPFSPPRQPGGAPGECDAILSVYRANLVSFRKEAEAALAAPSPIAAPGVT